MSESAKLSEIGVVLDWDVFMAKILFISKMCNNENGKD